LKHWTSTPRACRCSAGIQAVASQPLEGATALRLEQKTLHLQDLEASLIEEWASPEDEEAFADL